MFCLNQVVLGSSSIAITLFLFMLRTQWIIFGKVSVLSILNLHLRMVLIAMEIGGGIRQCHLPMLVL